jgi:hypothetical protein
MVYERTKEEQAPLVESGLFGLARHTRQCLQKLVILVVKNFLYRVARSDNSLCVGKTCKAHQLVSGDLVTEAPGVCEIIPGHLALNWASQLA